MPSVYDWSVTSANNANADSGINWAEGQAPSTVNNSARVMMARLKELLNDISGVAKSSGTATAITLTASSAFTAYNDGIVVTFRASLKNTGSCTLRVNGIGAKPIVKMTFTGETALVGGEIQKDGIYELVYSKDLNSGSGAWLILNPAYVDIIPPGFGGPYFGGAVPSGWLLCNGSAVSRTTYARLFAAIGTTWGAGNGTSTFNLPDGRNDYIRGASSTLALGTRQSDSIRSHAHTGETDESGEHFHYQANTGTSTAVLTSGNHIVHQGGHGGDWGYRLSGSSTSPSVGKTSTARGHKHKLTTSATGSAETRPRSIVANWIIKF